MNLTTAHFRILLVSFFIFTTWGFVTPSVDTGVGLPHFDKVMHFGVFFVLATLMDCSRITAKAFILISLFFYGTGIELYQGTLESRQASIADIIADMLGALSYFWGFDKILKPLLSASR